jgi:2-methylcitrate dehydratase PrpD
MIREFSPIIMTGIIHNACETEGIMATPTLTLAQFATTLRYEQLSAPLITRAKQYLLDTLGCGIYGGQTPWAKALNSLILEQGGKPEATLWLQAFRGPAASVALGLGVMMHSFELDDYHSGAKLHPGAAVLPAAFSIAERQGASGRNLLTALVAGYELMIRTSLASGPLSMRRRGWHITGICGTFGAAAAAGCLLGLDNESMANALGLAGTQSAGLMAFTCDGANSKRLHPGRAAQSGVLAADLASRGFTGPTAVLEYPDGGFCRAVSDDSDLEILTRGLGQDYVTADVSLKPYACCGSTHSSIDAVRWLVSQHSIRPEDVEEIVVYNHSVVKLQTSWWYEPVSPMQAQMNIEYCVAVALAEGNAGPQQFSSDKIADPQLVGLAHKVRFEVDPEIEEIYPRAFPGKVAIRLRDGRTVRHAVNGPKGSPQQPMTLEEVAEKFHLLVDPILGRRHADRLANLVAQIDSLENVQRIMELLQ